MERCGVYSTAVGTRLDVRLDVLSKEGDERLSKSVGEDELGADDEDLEVLAVCHSGGLELWAARGTGAEGGQRGGCKQRDVIAPHCSWNRLYPVNVTLA